LRSRQDACDGRLTKFGLQFRAQVWPGDTLVARARVKAVREEAGERFVDLELTTVNQNGVEVATGKASARLDA
jgi:acyl dehydratase